MFKSEPQSEDYEPKEEKLGSNYFSWLKLNFSGLFSHDKRDSRLGTPYVYGDEQLPDWALLGGYGNGSARGKGRSEYLWLPMDDQGAIPVGLYRNEQLYAIHTDHLGTPRLLTNDENKPVWQWAYSGFGNNKPVGVLQAQTNPEHATSKPALEFDLRFPGQIADSETGLFYNFFRNYQPSQGRYTQGDPIGLNGGLNRFSYVRGDPLRRADLRGLYWFQQPWQARDPIVGREGSIIEPGGPVGSVIKRYVPAGRTLGEIHDPLVDALTRAGVPDSIANIPTMMPAYIAAIALEILRSLGLENQPQPPLMCPRP